MDEGQDIAHYILDLEPDLEETVSLPTDLPRHTPKGQSYDYHLYLSLNKDLFKQKCPQKQKFALWNKEKGQL